MESGPRRKNRRRPPAARRGLERGQELEQELEQGKRPPRSGSSRKNRIHMSTSEIPALTEAELKLLQTLVYQECGMHFDDRRTPFLQDRLQRRLKECQLDSFYSYYRLLISQPGKQELTCLVENLTVNETSFFRNKAQLDLFQHDVIDDMVRRKQEHADYSLRIWSAGCSTGQEPYTLAMLVEQPALQIEGFAGLRQGLQLIYRLLDTYWDSVYPQMEDDGDLELRATPLRWVGSQLDSAIRLVPLTKAGHNWYQ